MPKKHIVQYGYVNYAFDSVTAATAAVAFFAKLRPVKLNTSARDYGHWHYEADEDRNKDVELKLNQNYREPAKEKSKKALELPAPKRGTILCICEKSYVAPRETCPHCGRDFSESHNRVHAQNVTPFLKLK